MISPSTSLPPIRSKSLSAKYSLLSTIAFNKSNPPFRLLISPIYIRCNIPSSVYFSGAISGGDTILLRTGILSLSIPMDEKYSFHDCDKTIKASHIFNASVIPCLSSAPSKYSTKSAACSCKITFLPHFLAR